MSEAKVQRVVLELDPGEPIRGRIGDVAGPVEPFRGWLELASRLERIRADATLGGSAAERLGELPA